MSDFKPAYVVLASTIIYRWTEDRRLVEHQQYSDEVIRSSSLRNVAKAVVNQVQKRADEVGVSLRGLTSETRKYGGAVEYSTILPDGREYFTVHSLRREILKDTQWGAATTALWGVTFPDEGDDE